MRLALQRVISLSNSPWDQQCGPQTQYNKEYLQGYYVGKQVGFELAAQIAREGLSENTSQ